MAQRILGLLGSALSLIAAAHAVEPQPPTRGSSPLDLQTSFALAQEIVGAGYARRLPESQGLPPKGVVMARPGGLGAVVQAARRRRLQVLECDATLEVCVVRASVAAGIALAREPYVEGFLPYTPASVRDGAFEYSGRRAWRPSPVPRPPPECLRDSPSQAQREWNPRQDRLLAIENVATPQARFGKGASLAIIEPHGAGVDLDALNRSHQEIAGGRKVRRLILAHEIDLQNVNSGVVRPFGMTPACEATVCMINGQAIAQPEGVEVQLGMAGIADTLLYLGFDAASERVWIDLDHDGRLEPEERLRDYNLTGDFVTLEDSHSPHLRSLGVRSVAVVFQEFAGERAWRIVFGRQLHAYMAASVAASADLPVYHGVAPWAELVMADGGESSVGMVEALLQTVRIDNVKVIYIGASLGWWPNDENSFWSRLIDRVSERYDKVVVLPAGNQSGSINTIDNPTSRYGIIASGYLDAESMSLLTEGAVVRDWIHSAYSRGPGRNGNLTPTVTVPSQRFYRKRFQAAERTIPWMTGCAALSTGTSSAGPTAAALIAGLIAEFDDSGRRAPPATAWQRALIATNETITTESIAAQGAGKIDTSRLKRYISSASLAPTSRGKAAEQIAAAILRPPETTLDRAPKLIVRRELAVGEDVSVPVRVPAGADALILEIEVTGGKVRLDLQEPWEQRATIRHRPNERFWGDLEGQGSRREVIRNPMPGLWHVRAINEIFGRTPGVLSILQPSSVDIRAKVARGVYAGFAATRLKGAFRQLPQENAALIEFSVPADVDILKVESRRSLREGYRFLFDCSSGHCLAVQHDVNRGAISPLIEPAPQPGSWVLVVIGGSRDRQNNHTILALSSAQ